MASGDMAKCILRREALSIHSQTDRLEKGKLEEAAARPKKESGRREMRKGLGAALGKGRSSEEKEKFSILS
jgi:hypothetical protein